MPFPALGAAFSQSFSADCCMGALVHSGQASLKLVRGRLGMRVGTSMPVWTRTTMEPFVIGSLWGNLSDDNQATLVSTGTTFKFEDKSQDMWGEVSAGVNFFNPSANTSVFAKVDVTFGDDFDGVGGKAGMRVSW